MLQTIFKLQALLKWLDHLKKVQVYNWSVTYVTGFGKIRLNAANNFFQYHGVKPYGSIFFEKIFMAEMDRHQLALAYDAVVSSGVL